MDEIDQECAVRFGSALRKTDGWTDDVLRFCLGHVAKRDTSCPTSYDKK